MKFLLFLFAVGKRDETVGEFYPIKIRFHFIRILITVLAVSMSIAAAARITKVKRDTSDERPACDQGCTFIYDPVCGWDGAEHKSFGNACLMKKHNCEIEPQGRSEFLFPINK